MADNETKQIFTVTQSRRRSGRNTFTDRKGAYGGGSVDEYTGYFKIIDMSDRDDSGNVTSAKIRVVNGAASYPYEDHFAGVISAYGKTFSIPAETINITGNGNQDSYIYLRFNDVDSDEPTEFISSVTELEDDGLGDLLLIGAIPRGMQNITQSVNTKSPVEMGNEYLGDFAVVPTGNATFRITGGIADIGSEVAPVNVSAPEWRIYLYGWYQNETYYVQLREMPPSGVEYYGRYLIAYRSDGIVHQQWRDGQIKFRDDYYL